MANISTSIPLRSVKLESIRELFEQNPDKILKLDASEYLFRRTLELNGNKAKGDDLRQLAKFERREDFARYDYRPGLGFALLGQPNNPRPLVQITWDPYWENTIGMKIICKDVKHVTDDELRLTPKLADMLKSLEAELQQ